MKDKILVVEFNNAGLYSHIILSSIYGAMTCLYHIKLSLINGLRMTN